MGKNDTTDGLGLGPVGRGVCVAPLPLAVLAAIAYHDGPLDWHKLLSMSVVSFVFAVIWIIVASILHVRKPITTTKPGPLFSSSVAQKTYEQGVESAIQLAVAAQFVLDHGESGKPYQ